MCCPIFPLSVQHVLLRRRCFHTFFLSNQFIFLPDRCSTPSITYHHLSSLECLKPSTFAHLILELNRSLILHFNSQFLVSLLQSSRENSTVFYFFGWGNRMNVFQKGGCIINFTLNTLKLHVFGDYLKQTLLKNSEKEIPKLQPENLSQY